MQPWDGYGEEETQITAYLPKKTVILIFICINSCSNDAEGVNRILNFVLRKYFDCKSKLGTAGLFEKSIEK